MEPDAEITVTVQLECGGATVKFIKSCSGPYNSDLADEAGDIADEAIDFMFPPEAKE